MYTVPTAALAILGFLLPKPADHARRGAGKGHSAGKEARDKSPL